MCVMYAYDVVVIVAVVVVGGGMMKRYKSKIAIQFTKFHMMERI